MHDVSPVKYLPGLQKAEDLSKIRDENCEVLAAKSRSQVSINRVPSQLHKKEAKNTKPDTPKSH